jgi:glycosyltransferase involved in cell wall biosynthesis
MIPFAIFKILKLHNHFDVLYCPGYQGIGIAAVIAGKISKKPVILKSGNIGVVSCENWNDALKHIKINKDLLIIDIAKKIMTKLYASADAFICISKEIEREAYEFNVDPNKINYLPEGVNINTFRPTFTGEKEKIRKKFNLPLDKLICIYVGRLSFEKGITDLIGAWDQLKTDNAILLIVGPEMKGHYMDAGDTVKKIVKSRINKENIVLYGSSNEVEKLLRASDIFVQPSHYEAFGISVIEAMSSGLPVIATKVGGMMDYLIDYNNSLLCQAKSANDIAAKLNLLIKDSALRKQLGQNARCTVEEYFSDMNIFKKYLSLFQKINLN